MIVNDPIIRFYVAVLKDVFSEEELRHKVTFAREGITHQYLSS